MWGGPQGQAAEPRVGIHLGPQVHLWTLPPPRASRVWSWAWPWADPETSDTLGTS